MKSVVLLGLGQIVSRLGTGMTRFAMIIWVWQITERVTPVALMSFFVFAPAILVSPVAGALVDRWNRKKVLIGADLIAGAATVALLFLYATDNLEIWHLYIAGAVASIAESFQAPAKMASLTMMVKKEQLSRANGIMSMAQFGSLVLSPALAGVLMPLVKIHGILLLDVASFLFAVTMLLFLRIPQPPAGKGVHKERSLWRETKEGLQYILARRSMIHVILVFTAVNILFGLFDGLLKPMVLARTAQDSQQLALVLTAQGIGGIAGGLFLSLWKGWRRRIHGVLLGTIGISLGLTVVGLGKESHFLWMLGAFCATFCIPIMNGCVLAIGQAKVAPDFQGRVFGTLRLLAQISYPLALASAGPLADFVFEPAMAAGGTLAASLGGVFGTGPGSGMSLLMVPCALAGFSISIFGYSFSSIRDIETLLPDAVPDAVPERDA